MRVVWYGEGPHTYDLAASCSNCHMRHVARLLCGTGRVNSAMCPYCGVGGVLTFVGSRTAALWLQEDDGESLFCAGGCGVMIGLIPDNPNLTFCETCWGRNLMLSLSEEKITAWEKPIPPKRPALPPFPGDTDAPSPYDW